MTSVDFNAWHMPVLTVETIDALSVKPDGLYLDLTAGGGGHSAAILEKLGKNGRLYAADRDPEALKICDARLSGIETSATYKTVHASFSEFPDWLQQEELGHVDGLLADLGVSSHQLDSSARGFSYLNDGPLDMRMNPEQSSTAADILSAIPESELVALLRLYGEERYATLIARAIIRAREKKTINRTAELAQIVSGAVPPHARREGNPARKTFQALRMAVNGEQQELAHLLHAIPDVMSQGGRAVVISFHSLEDRMVKQAMRRWQSPCECPRDFPTCVCGKQPIGHQVSSKPQVATDEEIQDNRRARSAKLRVFEFGGGVA
ncbi:MAG: 16S rRNA (cytosine(1402)-N(4))-methyltransferase RsmH [Clostridiaceae bacterium]|jgi:16S rRNA (cytosine1402-N4)-methyltransferase|nr:16S rRNA (cytosine(1402)-N(4))-methyltransferase RsmH [Clostridiaceae bacterium]